MSTIGSYGDILFEVSPYRILTPESLSRSASPRYGEHVPIGQKPLLQYQGPGLESVSVKIILSARLGAPPMETIQRLREMRDAGEAAALLIGETPLADGSGLFVLRDVGETWEETTHAGELVQASVNVTFAEYIETVEANEAKSPGVPAIIPSRKGEDEKSKDGKSSKSSTSSKKKTSSKSKGTSSKISTSTRSTSYYGLNPDGTYSMPGTVKPPLRTNNPPR